MPLPICVSNVLASVSIEQITFKMGITRIVMMIVGLWKTGAPEKGHALAYLW